MKSIDKHAALDLLMHLQSIGYQFVTITPASHGRVVARAGRKEAQSIRDILGWSQPYRPGAIDAKVERLLEDAGIVSIEDQLRHSAVRVSSLHGLLFLHSAYPTEAEDAVFFGPDSYRFADLIERELAAHPCAQDARIIDIGTGAGVGAIVAALAVPGAEVLATDVNPQALALASVNAQAAGQDVAFLEGRDLGETEGRFDLILANPPYIIDDEERAYRDGGGMHGGEVSVDMAQAALPRLNTGGRFILYTGSAIVDGQDQLQQRLGKSAERNGCSLSYRELDRDVFGEELEHSAYADVDRIAVVAAIFTRA
ncbi:methyltransferase [Sphingobium sp. SCG-1]|uniref:methyltransferase n=1 Tax=Sphingobium sp. SCG-1 TaxID=2072936 RepID=UPI000CD687C0|nr:class I SAM-dependent methyltransferase [Sphingobium sp. SCG-1]AUW57348.1 methyltransferase [Sphingobium sp. SCG-1]